MKYSLSNIQFQRFNTYSCKQSDREVWIFTSPKFKIQTNYDEKEWNPNPNLLLNLLVASMAKDDPEGWDYYKKTVRHAANDVDIHLLTDLKGVGDIEVNAFQRASDVVLQKSTREGFGLSVTEALWKEVPVIGGNVGGIPMQIIDCVNGFLVSSIQEAAEKTLYLLKQLAEAKRMGAKGKDYITKNFLITRHLEDYLKLLSIL